MPDIDLPDIDRIFDLIGRLLESMDDMFSIIFVLMVVFTFIDGSIRKKNKAPSLPPPLEDDFNVLPLDDTTKIEVSREVKVKPPVKSRPSKNYQPITVRSTESLKSTEDRAELSADEAREAMILKEIFDRPKSMRRR